jgi:hypothetical protein
MGMGIGGVAGVAAELASHQILSKKIRRFRMNTGGRVGVTLNCTAKSQPTSESIDLD